MKTLRRIALFAIVLLMLGMMTSCNFVLDFYNKFWVGEVDYDISHMAQEYITDIDGGMWMISVILMSEGIKYDETTAGQWPFDGEGNVIALKLRVPDSSLREGDYDWSDIDVAETMAWGRVWVNATFDDGALLLEPKPTWVFEVNSGTAWVAEPLLGGFAVDFELTGHDNVQGVDKIIEGQFRGPAEKVEAAPR